MVEFSARPIRLVRGRVVSRQGSGWVPAKYGTLHVVTARDCLWMRPLVQPVLETGRELAGV